MLSSLLQTYDIKTDIDFLPYPPGINPGFYHDICLCLIGILIYTSKIVYITWEITYRYKNTGSFLYCHTKHGSCITDIRQSILWQLPCSTQQKKKHAVLSAFGWSHCRSIFLLTRWSQCDVNILNTEESFTLSNQPSVHWNVNTIDAQFPACYSSFWVPHQELPLEFNQDNGT